MNDENENKIASINETYILINKNENSKNNKNLLNFQINNI